MNSKSTTQKIIIAALLASLTCVATMIIKIPTPLKGYINLGDCIVLLAGWLLSPFYGFLAAGLGSALADLLSGYALYTPATFIIKGIMALIAFYIFKLLNKNNKTLLPRILSGILAEIWMILGYFIFEGVLYGFLEAAVNIPSGIIQGIAGIIVGLILIKVFEKNKITF